MTRTKGVIREMGGGEKRMSIGVCVEVGIYIFGLVNIFLCIYIFPQNINPLAPPKLTGNNFLF